MLGRYRQDGDFNIAGKNWLIHTKFKKIQTVCNWITEEDYLIYTENQRFPGR